MDYFGRFRALACLFDFFAILILSASSIEVLSLRVLCGRLVATDILIVRLLTDDIHASAG